MILSNVDSNKYREDFKAKFTNFGDKAPIILSFATDEMGVTIVHENSGTKYFYGWDYSIPLKAFIHNIKQDLSGNHYPRISRMEVKVTPTSPERAAQMIEEGCDVNAVPAEERHEEEVIYIIDKILALRDEFIIVNEKTREQYCYKMQGSGIYFLKNYREGVYKSLLEAGDAFFKKSTLVCTLDKES